MTASAISLALLLAAVQSARPGLLKRLLSLGAPVDAADGNGVTALMVAAASASTVSAGFSREARAEAAARPRLA
mgnify:CR=1 FL=1